MSDSSSGNHRWLGPAVLCVVVAFIGGVSVGYNMENSTASRANASMDKADEMLDQVKAGRDELHTMTQQAVLRANELTRIRNAYREVVNEYRAERLLLLESRLAIQTAVGGRTTIEWPESVKESELTELLRSLTEKEYELDP